MKQSPHNWVGNVIPDIYSKQLVTRGPFFHCSADDPSIIPTDPLTWGSKDIETAG